MASKLQKKNKFKGVAFKDCFGKINGALSVFTRKTENYSKAKCLVCVEMSPGFLFLLFWGLFWSQKDIIK